MKIWIFVLFLFSGSCYLCSGQVNQTPATQPAQRTNDEQKRANERMSRRADGSFEALRSLDVPQTFQKPPLEVIGQDIQPLYRKPGKKDLKNLLPSEALLARHERFLKQPNTGIFKLSADSTCARNTTVVAATESCASNTIPGGGTAFSFRAGSHRILHLADLMLDRDILKTDGVMQQGIMVSLGNLDLEQVTTETRGVRFLLDFKPAAGKAEMQQNDQKLSAGIENDGFIYRFGFYVDDQTTFALRSIAYRGRLIRSVKGVNYNEMDYDKRKDVLIVFRIVAKDANGDVTILWKELARKDSPILDFN